MDDKLILLERDLKVFKPVLSKAADTVINEDVSKYPIFVVHQHQVDMGIPLIVMEENQSKWSINVSTLEEFVTKQIIQIDKIDEFRKVYKEAEGELCLFVLSELGATFIFLPKTEFE